MEPDKQIFNEQGLLTKAGTVYFNDNLKGIEAILSQAKTESHLRLLGSLIAKFAADATFEKIQNLDKKSK